MKQYTKATLTRNIEVDKVSLFTDAGFSLSLDKNGKEIHKSIKGTDGVTVEKVQVIMFEDFSAEIPSDLNEMISQVGDSETYELAVRTFITNKVLAPAVSEIFTRVGYVTVAERKAGKNALALFKNAGGKVDEDGKVVKPAKLFGQTFDTPQAIFKFATTGEDE